MAESGRETQGHTPGPWLIEPPMEWGSRPIKSAGGYSIAKAFGGFSDVDANARLIAAAPDLLAACKAASRLLFGDDGNRELDSSDAETVWIAARAAIAKAEGRS